MAAKQDKKAKIKKLKIYTDSKMAISCYEKWIPIWKRNDWKKTNGKPVIDKIEMDKELKTLDALLVSNLLIESFIDQIKGMLDTDIFHFKDWWETENCRYPASS